MPSAHAANGGVRLRLDATEAEVLRDLVSQMLGLLGDADPDDPAVARLFPEAYPDDPDDQHSYDELVGDDLRDAKVDAFTSVAEELGTEGGIDTELDAESAELWLKALTDARLTLGERVGVSEERMSAEPDPTDPQAPVLAVMHWLGWLQELILGALGG